MRPSAYIAFAGFLFLSAGSADGQFVPLEAKVRDTQETMVGGKVSKTEVKEGLFFRSSDGSTLTQWRSVNGEESSAADLFDNKGGNSYKIDYKQRRAFTLANGRGESVKPGGYHAIKKDIGTDSVEGIACRIIPAKAISPGTRAPEDIGKSCISADYDLVLWWDVRTSGAGNEALHSKHELYDMKLGTEPDPKLFRVDGLTVIGQQSFKPTSSTPAR